MGNSRVMCRARQGVTAPLVEVETHLGPGLPGFNVVGLPETAVREARDRVRSAISNSGYQFPQQRITVNLAPADLPKSGGRYDLAIAVGILSASKQVPTPGQEMVLVAELALSGALRPVPGVLPAALACQNKGQHLLVASANAVEASRCAGTRVLSGHDLNQVCQHLKGEARLDSQQPAPMPTYRHQGPCLSELRGQPQARRALEIAAAGGHSLLLCGPPGSGKSMLASRLPGLLPPLSQTQAMEVASIYSLSRPRTDDDFLVPPFRHPHHTASSAAIVGGGADPRPGEISLAHHGVLFLDELPEFGRRVLEVLREPLENGSVDISRAAGQTRFPARFQLVTAMNPCPCGYLGNPERSCGYSCEKARRYQGKLSGPLLDRIDLQLDVQPVESIALLSLPQSESSEEVRQRVIAARARQLNRQPTLNNQLQRNALEECMREHSAWLQRAMDQLGLSARALLRVVRVARTIADLNEEEQVPESALAEALCYRRQPP